MSRTPRSTRWDRSPTLTSFVSRHLDLWATSWGRRPTLLLSTLGTLHFGISSSEGLRKMSGRLAPVNCRPSTPSRMCKDERRDTYTVDGRQAGNLETSGNEDANVGAN